MKWLFKKVKNKILQPVGRFVKRNKKELLTAGLIAGLVISGGVLAGNPAFVSAFPNFATAAGTAVAGVGPTTSGAALGTLPIAAEGGKLAAAKALSAAGSGLGTSVGTSYVMGEDPFADPEMPSRPTLFGGVGGPLPKYSSSLSDQSIAFAGPESLTYGVTGTSVNPFSRGFRYG